MIKGTAPMRLKLEFNGTDEELVDLVDALATAGGQRLDSLDLGDAMGWLITTTMANDSDFSITIGPRTLKTTIEFDFFEWERDDDDDIETAADHINANLR
ncbi:MAG: hypothetical protein LC687_00015 [Actinobacteria bacterium]|nr:hypothetical protein [Actinomycetota bacterium]